MKIRELRHCLLAQAALLAQAPKVFRNAATRFPCGLIIFIHSGPESGRLRALYLQPIDLPVLNLIG